MKNVKIQILIKNKNNLFANANLSINTTELGCIKIKGFQVWKSKNFNKRLQASINITPPQNSYHGNYLAIVFFEDLNKWYLLEELIYKNYCEKRDQEINIEEIPEL